MRTLILIGTLTSAASAMAQQPSEQLILDCMNEAFSVWQKVLDNTRGDDLQRLDGLDRMLTERCMFEHEFKFRTDIRYCTTNEYMVSNPLCYERIR